MELSIGDTLLYTNFTGLRVPAKLVGLCRYGHLELEHAQGAVRVVNHRPMDSISFGIQNVKFLPPSTSIPAITLFQEIPFASFLMEAAFTVAL